MIKWDGVVQWLVSDVLKQDQFNFLFETIQVIYNSPARDKLLAMDKNVLDNVISKLLAYRSVMVIRNIQLKQAEEKAKLREKMEREGKGFHLENNTNMRYKTEFEKQCLQLDEKVANDPTGTELTEVQI